jgi:glycosyltransferase involved in cell wall biosynthesis
MFQSKSVTPADARTRNITFVHDTRAFGGIEIVILELLRHLDPKRFRSSVMISGLDDRWSATPPLFIEKVTELKVPILKPSHPGLRPVLSTFRNIIDMAKLFRLAQTDVVHIHTARVSGARKATISARLAGVPVVLRTEHNSPTAFSSPSTRNYTQKFFDLLTNLIITVSEHDRQEQIHYVGRNSKKVYCSHNGVDMSRFDITYDCRSAKTALGFQPDSILIGTVGRLVEQKGHRYLIDAAAKILNQHSNVHFILVGNGMLEQELRAQAESLGITNNVHFAGYHSDPLPYIKAFDIAVMSSLHEGFSLSMLEFMAMAKPTVVTNHPSLLEASIEGVTSLVVEMCSGQALAQGIQYLLNNPDQAQAMGRAARQHVETHFTFDRFVKDMIVLYEHTPSSPAWPSHQITPST